MLPVVIGLTAQAPSEIATALVSSRLVNGFNNSFKHGAGTTTAPKAKRPEYCAAAG